MRFLQYFGDGDFIERVGLKKTIFIKCTKHLMFKLVLGPKEKMSFKTAKDPRLLSVLSWGMLGHLTLIVTDLVAILMRTPRHLQKTHHPAAVCSFS